MDINKETFNLLKNQSSKTINRIKNEVGINADGWFKDREKANKIIDEELECILKENGKSRSFDDIMSDLNRFWAMECQ